MAKPWHRQAAAQRTCSRPGKDPPWRALADDGFKTVGISWTSACCDRGILPEPQKKLRERLSKIHWPIPTCVQEGVNIIALLRCSTLKHSGWKAMTMTNHKFVERLLREETNWLARAQWAARSVSCIYHHQRFKKGGRTQNVSYIFQGVSEGGPWKCKLTFWRYFEDSPHKNDTLGTFSNQFYI